MHSFHSVTYLILPGLILICFIVIHESHFIPENCQLTLQNWPGQPITESQPPSRWAPRCSCEEARSEETMWNKDISYCWHSSWWLGKHFWVPRGPWHLVIPPFGWGSSTSPTHSAPVLCKDVGLALTHRVEVICILWVTCATSCWHIWDFIETQSLKGEGREMKRCASNS